MSVFVGMVLVVAVFFAALFFLLVVNRVLLRRAKGWSVLTEKEKLEKIARWKSEL